MERKKRIVTALPFIEPVEAALSDSFDTVLAPTVYSAQDLAKAAADHQAEAVVISGGYPLKADAIALLPACVKVIGTYSAGFNHIDLSAAEQKRLAVCYTPYGPTISTADCTMLLILATMRKVHDFQIRLYKKDLTAWSQPTPQLGYDVTNKILGLVGMGRIAQAVAKRANGFDMKIHYYARNEIEPIKGVRMQYHNSLETLFRISDVISLHVPSTPQTKDIINAKSLSWLRHQAMIINTGRGDLVNDNDLIKALESGRIGGAGLDVFMNEPHIDPRYYQMNNVFLTPHIGSATIEGRTLMGRHVIDGLNAFFAGKASECRLL